MAMVVAGQGGGKEEGKAQQGMDAGTYVRHILEQVDPNPQTGITVSEVNENEWFKKGYQPPSFETPDVNLDDVDTIFSGSGGFANLVVWRRGGGPAIMYAFELISTSTQGLNLGTRFEKQIGTVKQEMRFASRLPADEMLSKIEQAATPLGFNVEKQNYKVFEVALSLYLVELRKSKGDTLEFHMVSRNLSTSLKDVVWKSQ